MLTRSFAIGTSRDLPNFVSLTVSAAFLKSASSCLRRVASPRRSPVPYRVRINVRIVSGESGAVFG